VCEKRDDVIPNLFGVADPTTPGEVFEALIETLDVKLERIVSRGHATPAGQWYEQSTDEWVAVLRGSASLRFEDESEPVVLRPGDHVLILAGRRHRVEWTDPAQPTVWLALHYRTSPARPGERG
jgi:cupin 2 domain-containing protein